MSRDFVYLASASPRRRELLEQIGVRYEVRAAEIDERMRAGEAPPAYVERLAAAKAAAVARSLPRPTRPVLAADTAVVVDGRAFGKPADERDALAMLEALSGRTHRVLSAVALHDAGGVDTVLSVSEVRFRSTTAGERAAYCRTGEPYDKAGAYAIQGLGAVFVEHLAGSYSAVMGLPVFETAGLLARHGLPDWLAHGGAAAERQ